jgi:hypothetical protein
LWPGFVSEPNGLAHSRSCSALTNGDGAQIS